MFSTLWQKAMAWIKSSGFWFAVLTVIYLMAWAANALLSTKFDLGQLKDYAMWVIAKFGADSVFNSNRGEKP